MNPESESQRGECRFCKAPLTRTFVDLGMSPLCQRHVRPDQLKKMEPFYPLHAYVCDECLLVQVEQIVTPREIYEDYAYFSSYSQSWLTHCETYAKTAIDRFKLGTDSYVVELASNDGYLLQYFAAGQIPVLGIEPASTVANAAIRKGIPTEIAFFGNDSLPALLKKYERPTLLIGNNVLAHVPDINDFVSAMKQFLHERGVITMEFPHLYHLVANNEFDTIYHEHYSYLSFTTVERIFAHHGLTIFDVEEIPTHGGSLRIYAKHADDNSKAISNSVNALRGKERRAGMLSVEYYESFAEKVKQTKRKILQFLIDLKRSGKTIAGYGAPGKGNTLLNYCGLRTDFIDFTVDVSPHKQGNYLPGTHIPIYHPDMIREAKPDFVFILPWNLKHEIMNQLSYIDEWNGRFIVPIPEPRMFDVAGILARV